jgi:hypothetical protein
MAVDGPWRGRRSFFLH